MEGPFQLADSVIDAVINNTGPAVFLLRRIEETPKYAYYRALYRSHRRQPRRDTETVA